MQYSEESKGNQRYFYEAQPQSVQKTIITFQSLKIKTDDANQWHTRGERRRKILKSWQSGGQTAKGKLSHLKIFLEANLAVVSKSLKTTYPLNQELLF